MKMLKVVLIAIVSTVLVFSAYTILVNSKDRKVVIKTATAPVEKDVPVNQTTQTNSVTQNQQPSTEKTLCNWVDNSDIIIKLTFADNVTKDTSYEAGFYYNPLVSNMRLARSVCDYNTGFSFKEMENKGAVQVGVRGYSDNKRRLLEHEPMTVIFDENGRPNVALPITVKVLN